jgi:hypothetical protein
MAGINTCMVVHMQNMHTSSQNLFIPLNNNLSVNTHECQQETAVCCTGTLMARMVLRQSQLLRAAATQQSHWTASSCSLVG